MFGDVGELGDRDCSEAAENGADGLIERLEPGSRSTASAAALPSFDLSS